MIEKRQEPPYGSCFYSLPLLGPEKWKRERTASGVRRMQSIGESYIDVNSHKVFGENKISNGYPR